MSSDIEAGCNNENKQRDRCEDSKKEDMKKDDWVEKMRNALMVVASLIATMAFQAGLTPPGGLWQEGSKSNSPSGQPEQHKAGYSILYDYEPLSYDVYIAFNTTGFVASLSIILLLVSGLPFFTNKHFVVILTVVLWVAITAMGVTYLISIANVTESTTCSSAAVVVQLVWFCLMVVLILGHLIRLLVKIIKFLVSKIMSLTKKLCNCCL